MLPKLKAAELDISYFPTKWQAVVFKNYGKVRVDRLASILGASVSDIEQAAKDLGIDKIEFQSEWESRGYISIIRNNWYLLNYDQLTKLLNMSYEALEHTLKEDDFLFVKLGEYKPDCAEIKYAPLTAEQQALTAEIKKIVNSVFCKKNVKYFDFYGGFLNKLDIKAANIKNSSKIKNRILYSYSAVYGDPLIEGDFSSYPKELLQKLQGLGVNGLWMQGLLYQLCEFPFDKSYSKGYKTRIKNLNKLIEYAGGYGIKIYLYMN